MVYNYIKKNKPGVLHCPDPDGDVFFKKIAEQKLLSPTVDDSKVLQDLTVVTWNSEEQVSILEKSLKKYNIEPIVLGKNIKNFKNNFKIDLTINEIKKIKTKYIMGVDAFDAIFLDKPSNILKKFLLKKNKIIFNSTLGNWPIINQILKFEKEKFNKFHLNAGVWIAHRDTAEFFWNRVKSIDIEKKSIDFVELIKKYNLKKENNLLDSEQLRVKIATMDLYPLVGIDESCELFQVIAANCYYSKNTVDTKCLWTYFNMPLL